MCGLTQNGDEKWVEKCFKSFTISFTAATFLYQGINWRGKRLTAFNDSSRKFHNQNVTWILNLTLKKDWKMSILMLNFLIIFSSSFLDRFLSLLLFLLLIRNFLSLFWYSKLLKECRIENKDKKRMNLHAIWQQQHNEDAAIFYKLKRKLSLSSTR